MASSIRREYSEGKRNCKTISIRAVHLPCHLLFFPHKNQIENCLSLSDWRCRSKVKQSERNIFFKFSIFHSNSVQIVSVLFQLSFALRQNINRVNIIDHLRIYALPILRRMPKNDFVSPQQNESHPEMRHLLLCSLWDVWVCVCVDASVDNVQLSIEMNTRSLSLSLSASVCLCLPLCSHTLRRRRWH